MSSLTTPAGIVFGPLLRGLGVTLQITAVSLVLAFLIGLTTALMRLSGSILGRLTARTYLELVRNTPLLVQIFFIYFVLSPVLQLSAFASAVLALSLFEGAYVSEIFRAGILSIHRGQWEAAFSSGLGPWHTYRRVILPQAVRNILPPLTSQAISLIKDSALVSTIAIYDLTMQGQAIIAETYLVFEIWFTVAALYLVITLALSLTVAIMEKKLTAKTLICGRIHNHMLQPLRRNHEQTPHSLYGRGRHRDRVRCFGRRRFRRLAAEAG